MLKLKERIISLLAAAGMVFSVFPQGIVYAAEKQDDITYATQEEPAAKADVNAETDWLVSVVYTDEERSEAKITYQKPGVKADNVNLLYLADTSANGKESFTAARKMLRDNGLGYIFDYSSSPLACSIAYQNNVVTDTGWLSGKISTADSLNKTPNPGYGTPDEVKALQAAQAAIDKLPAGRRKYPTIVF